MVTDQLLIAWMDWSISFNIHISTMWSRLRVTGGEGIGSLFLYFTVTVSVTMMVVACVGLTSKQRASISQGWIFMDSCM